MNAPTCLYTCRVTYVVMESAAGKTGEDAVDEPDGQACPCGC